MDYKEKVIAILNSKKLSKEQKEKLEEIFPELRESEDERIRKGILHLIGCASEIEWCKANVSIGEVQTWLENQCEKTNPYSGISFEYNGHIWGMCARDNGVDILLDKQLLKHLEKHDFESEILKKYKQ